jgi:hypothetical protein
MFTWLLAFTVIALAVLVWRYASVQALFSYGLESKAIINSVSFYKDRGKIFFKYTFEGQKYRLANHVMRTKRTSALRIGAEVDILIDRNNPKRAILRDLFL